MSPGTSRIEGLLRELAPQALGALIRRYGRFDNCEDAVQEALLEAAVAWPRDGLPTNPRGWLITVASRRFIDQVRSDTSRRQRETRDALLIDTDATVAGEDDTLLLLLTCCHPSLTAPSQIALTLRAVGGLTTSEIASAFMVPEATMAQRISRAKRTIATAGASFARPSDTDLADRLEVVMHVLYLIFTEGHTTTSGPDVQRVDLTSEAIRLTRQLRAQISYDPELDGVLALMLLTDARRAARSTPTNPLVPLDEQDRTLWNRGQIAEAVMLVETALASGPLGSYQLQAAIAAVHCETLDTADTDWLQILGLYDLLRAVAPNPMVTLNRAVAVAMVLGPEHALTELDNLEHDEHLAGHHRLAAVRGHILELAGRAQEARHAFTVAASATRSQPERVEMLRRAAGIADKQRSAWPPAE
jgi:RNA polymerase sigma factor (sigma-70 family)